MRYINYMRLVHLSLAVAMVALCVAGAAFGATGGTSKQSYVADEYIIKVRPGSSLDQVQASVAKIGGQLLRALPITDTYLIKMTGKSKSRNYSALSRTASVSQWMIESIQPNYLYYPTVEPDDALWDQQWDKISMGMPKVWDIEKGSATVTVAVLDTGVDYNHPDLQDRAIKSIGYDFVDDDDDPIDEDVSSPSHGTHVAGIIAAQGDNGVGTVGVCWNNVIIMPVRVLGTGGGTSEMVINGLEHARLGNAQIVNMSLGAPYPDEAIHSKIQDLAKEDILVVAASGNTGNSPIVSDRRVNWPASYEECLAVASTGPNDKIAPYSSFGPDSYLDAAGNCVIITAPGGDQSVGYTSGIYSTIVNFTLDKDGKITDRAYEWGYMQGTSMACPQVSGAAALLLSAGVSATDLRNQMIFTARIPSKGYDEKKFGAGIIDLQAALGSAVVSIVNPADSSTSVSNPKVEVRLLAIDIDTVSVQVDSVDAILVGDAINYADKVVGGISFNIPLPGGVALAPGTHKITASGESKINGEIVSDEVSFTVATNPVESGIYLFAFPYLVDEATQGPDYLLPGTTFALTSPTRSKLIRWIAAPQSGTVGQSQYGYVTYNPANTSNVAWNTATLNLGGFDWSVNGGYYNATAPGTGRITHPIVGSGYWLVIPSDTYIRENLDSLEGRIDFDPSKGYMVRLYAGWNIFGNPYPRKVSWQTCLFRYRGETKGLLSAVDAGWLSTVAYGYDSTISRDYRRVTSRDSLDAYRGYWVRSYVGDVDNPLELIVLP